MKEEFNLSAKEKTKIKGTDWSELEFTFYLEDDVKEFIRRLKKEFGEMLINTSYLWKSAEIIDKLAGEKLK
jgi:hypothetical protein